jgi:hypothetical protein
MPAEILDINGKTLRLTLHREGVDQWHWMLAAPGELVLSGTAPDAREAAAEARRCAYTLVHQRGEPQPAANA